MRRLRRLHPTQDVDLPVSLCLLLLSKAQFHIIGKSSSETSTQDDVFNSLFIEKAFIDDGWWHDHKMYVSTTLPPTDYSYRNHQNKNNNMNNDNDNYWHYYYYYCYYHDNDTNNDDDDHNENVTNIYEMLMNNVHLSSIYEWISSDDICGLVVSNVYLLSNKKDIIHEVGTESRAALLFFSSQTKHDITWSYQHNRDLCEASTSWSYL